MTILHGALMSETDSGRLQEVRVDRPGERGAGKTLAAQEVGVYISYIQHIIYIYFYINKYLYTYKFTKKRRFTNLHTDIFRYLHVYTYTGIYLHMYILDFR